MSSKGGYAAPPDPPPRNAGDRFYNAAAAAVRRHQHQQQHAIFQQQMVQMHLLQQQQQQEFQLQERRMRRRQGVEKAESSSDKRRGEQQGDGSSREAGVALALPPSVGGYNAKLTNLDRLMKSLTPCIPVQYLSSESNGRGRKTREVETYPFFCLEALWESFYEWSVYGAGVPFLLNGIDPVEQYYVPYLSGIQLYMDPSKVSSQLKMFSEEIDAKSCRLTSSVGNSDLDLERKPTSIINLNTQCLNRLSLGDEFPMNSSSSETEVANLPGPPMFQFFEHEQPHTRRPLADKISVLTSQHPELSNCRSCDLLPASWICVAWYPIYRIPVGSSLKDVDACFLTFHSLSTQSKSCSKTQIHTQNARKNHANVDPAAKISLPVFALASYKLKDSIVRPSIPREWEQEKSLLKAADEWLKQLQVNLPDYQFFRSQPPYRR